MRRSTVDIRRSSRSALGGSVGGAMVGVGVGVFFWWSGYVWMAMDYVIESVQIWPLEMEDFTLLSGAGKLAFILLQDSGRDEANVVVLVSFVISLLRGWAMVEFDILFIYRSSSRRCWSE